jgi:hypothetical protein
MKFMITGIATIGFTEVIEAPYEEEAIKKLKKMKIVDLGWDYEEIESIDEITEVANGHQR